MTIEEVWVRAYCAALQALIAGGDVSPNKAPVTLTAIAETVANKAVDDFRRRFR